MRSAFLLITASQLAPASASGNEAFVSTVFISFYFPTSR